MTAVALACAQAAGCAIPAVDFHCDSYRDCGDGYVCAAGACRACDPDPVTSLALGASHTCAAGDGVRCWGANAVGQVGAGPGDRFVVPTRVELGASFTGRVFAGTTASYAAPDHQHALRGWGDNRLGQLGIDPGAAQVASRPLVAPTVSNVKLAAGGDGHACALDGALSTVTCWGDGARGELGRGLPDPGGPPGVIARPPFEDVLVRLSQAYAVAAGAHHACAVALDEGDGLWCWGANDHYQLGVSDRSDQPFAVMAARVDPYGFVAAGSAHTCVASAAGEVLCWGLNDHGQVSDTGDVDVQVPHRISVPPGVCGGLTAGRGHTCALLDGAVYCWGDNRAGQLGNPAAGAVDHVPPVPVMTAPATPLVDVRELRAGGDHTCAVTTQGVLYCWGANDEGQLGDGTQNARALPERIGVCRGG